MDACLSCKYNPQEFVPEMRILIFFAVSSCFLAVSAGEEGGAVNTRLPRQSLDCPGPLALEILQSAPSYCTPALTELGTIQDYVANYGRVIDLFRTVCQEDCLPILYNFTVHCSRSNAPILTLACATNDQMYPCYAAVAQNNGTEVYTHCYAPLLAMGSGMPPQASLGCSTECSAAVQQFRNDIGCCVNNAFNTTAFGLSSFGFANPTLWSACNVPTVSFCPNPLTATQPPPTATSGGTIRAALHKLVLLFELSLWAFATLFLL